MTAYYTSEAYDAPAATIWSVLTDFPTWPRWFPRVSEVRLEDGAASGAAGARIIAFADDPDVWPRGQIVGGRAPARLVCEHIDSNAPMTAHVQAAYLQFELFEEPEGCTLEVEIGADGYGVVGDFFVGMTLGPEVRRMLPDLAAAFTDHVVERARNGR